MKVLVTGGAGFIGSHVAEALLKEGNEVLILDNFSTGKRENLPEGAKLFQADIRDKEIGRLFAEEKPEAVFHFAAHIEARVSVADPIGDAETNILGSLNVFEQCKKHGVGHVVFASSGGEVYGFPTTLPVTEDHLLAPVSPYGVAKLAAEHYLLAYRKLAGIKATILRYGNVYGPGQNPKGEAGVVAIFADRLLREESPVIHGDGKQTKDYIYIADAVEATLLAFSKRSEGVINIGTGKETSVNEILELLRQFAGSTVEAEHAPLPAITADRFVLSIDKAAKELGWTPKYSLKEGLQETLRWLQK